MTDCDLGGETAEATAPVPAPTLPVEVCRRRPPRRRDGERTPASEGDEDVATSTGPRRGDPGAVIGDEGHCRALALHGRDDRVVTCCETDHGLPPVRLADAVALGEESCSSDPADLIGVPVAYAVASSTRTLGRRIRSEDR